MKIYVTGPGDGNGTMFLRAATKLQTEMPNYEVVIPDHAINAGLPDHFGAPCPPGPRVGRHAIACRLRVGLASLLTCDAIAMLPGWETNEGARLELQVAAACGLEIFYLLADRGRAAKLAGAV